MKGPEGIVGLNGGECFVFDTYCGNSRKKYHSLKRGLRNKLGRKVYISV
jgi:hypothetical protein